MAAPATEFPYAAMIGSLNGTPIKPKANKYETLVDVVKNTNNWTKYHSTVEYWNLQIEGDSRIYGKTHVSTVDAVKAAIELRGKVVLATGKNTTETVSDYEGLKGWELDEDNKTITILGNSAQERTNVLRDTWAVFKPQAVLDTETGEERFAALLKYRNEDEAVFGPDGEIFRCERSMTTMFGLPGYGMLAIMYFQDEDGQYWFASGLRAADKATYPAMWDVVSGGCVSIDETGQPATAVGTFIKEGGEEASLDEDFLKGYATPIAAVGYTTVRDHRAVGNQTKYDYGVHDDVMTVFKIEVKNPRKIKLLPRDGEVQYFRWANAAQLIKGMLQGDFKPNCALAITYMLLRLNLLNHIPYEERAEIAELVFTKPEFALSPDVKNTLEKILKVESIEAQIKDVMGGQNQDTVVVEQEAIDEAAPWVLPEDPFTYVEPEEPEKAPETEVDASAETQN